jgi:hypothetical protein
MTDQVASILGQLKAPQSPKRRAAAKKVRRLGTPSAGPALLAALEREVLDPRTWETQYQIIMALAESGYRDALPFLDMFARRPLEARMLYVALGDAIVRLSRHGPSDVTPVLRILREGRHPMLLDGAFRAMAMLRLVPETSAVTEIIDHANRLAPDDALRFWVLAATPGWSGPKVKSFIEACARSSRPDLQEAASLAQAGKYKIWRPL